MLQIPLVCDIAFPTGPIVAEFLDSADFDDPITGGNTSSNWGKFHITTDSYNIMHSLGLTATAGSGTERAQIKYSDDGGLNWQLKASLPDLNYTDPSVPTNVRAFPRVWEYLGGSSWEVWAYNENSYHGYYRTDDNGDTWSQYPMNRNPNTTSVNDLITNRNSGVRSWGRTVNTTQYYVLGENMNNPTENEFTWTGLWRREKSSSRILQEVVIRETAVTINRGCEPLEDNDLCLIYGYSGGDRTVYKINSTFGTVSGTGRTNQINSCDWVTNNRRYIFFMAPTGGQGKVYKWDKENATLTTLPEIILPDQFNQTTCGGVKPYLWMFASIEGNLSTTVRLYYSQYSDASIIDVNYVDLILPNRPSLAVAPVLKAGPDNWWYMTYRNDEAGDEKWQLVRFQFEILSCPASEYVFLDEAA